MSGMSSTIDRQCLISRDEAVNDTNVELEELKKIVAPIRVIFDHAMEFFTPNIAEIRTSHEGNSDACPGRANYILYQWGETAVTKGMQRPENLTGRAAIPCLAANMPAHQWLQTAILKLNHCEFACITCIPCISDALPGTGVKVDWITVKPKADFILTYAVDQAMAISHSVMRLTTRSGSQYVADFTVEQMCYNQDNWFMPLSDYLEKCTIDGILDVGTEEWEEWANEEFNKWAFMSKAQKVIRQVCSEIDWWGEYASIDETNRVEWLRLKTEEIWAIPLDPVD